MERYDYRAAVLADVNEYISCNINLADWAGRRDDLEEELNEKLWVEDSVTGNGSGSYTFSTWEAEENLCHNMDLLADALREFGGDCDILERGAEACDVTIRCYLLGECISEALDGLADELEADDDNDGYESDWPTGNVL